MKLWQAVLGILVAEVGMATVLSSSAVWAQSSVNSCRRNSARGATAHGIYIQFDNTHFRGDNPYVSSDLEQTPHLLNFIRDNGTLLTNDHIELISHTVGGILSSLTGIYPDRHRQTVSSSYVRTSSTGGFSFPKLFDSPEPLSMRVQSLGNPKSDAEEMEDVYVRLNASPGHP
jgi:hypothetical protein